MSEFFAGVTFDGQPVAPADDAVLHRVLLPDGILEGCAFRYSAAALTMEPGSFMICGRQARHTSAQTWQLTDAASGYARILLTADLSKAATEDTFDQLSDSLEYATTLEGFAQLETADINAAGVRYQVEACVVSLGSSGITGIVRSMPELNEVGVYAPAGYGPGQTTARVLVSRAELDNQTKTGVYRLLLPLADSYVAGVDIRKATVSVEGYDALTTLQTVSVVDRPTRLHRWRTDGTWGPWAVENPPMAAGAEYLTTELWNGWPVYIKRLAFTAASFTGQSVSLPHSIEGMGTCISAHAIWKRTDTADDGWRQLPASEHSTTAWDGQIEYVGAENIQFRLGASLMYILKTSTEPVSVTLKYTKQ